MPSITLTIDGDPSGALSAAKDVTSAVSEMSTRVAAGEAAMASYEAKTASVSSSTFAMRSKLSDAFAMTNDFLTIAVRASGEADSLASKASEAVGAIGRIAM